MNVLCNFFDDTYENSDACKNCQYNCKWNTNPEHHNPRKKEKKT